jgi:hypothetical protein
MGTTTEMINEFNYGKNFKTLETNAQIKELQTIIRDR